MNNGLNTKRIFAEDSEESLCNRTASVWFVYIKVMFIQCVLTCKSLKSCLISCGHRQWRVCEKTALCMTGMKMGIKRERDRERSKHMRASLAMYYGLHSRLKKCWVAMETPVERGCYESFSNSSFQSSKNKKKLALLILWIHSTVLYPKPYLNIIVSSTYVINRAEDLDSINIRFIRLVKQHLTCSTWWHSRL